MKYTTFQKKVRNKIRESGLPLSEISVLFLEDKESGRFIARLSDEHCITFIGNRSCERVECSWNNGNHRAIVAI